MSQQEIDQTIMDIIADERILGSTNIIRIGATCVAEIDGRFFLIVEVRVGTQNERVLVIRITQALATALVRAGVETCQVVSVIPISSLGREVEFECAFQVDDEVILVFIVRNVTDEIVLVRVPLCNVI